MSEPTTLGPYLRHERERRGLALKTISEKTKVSMALFKGLETDDISRWPGGIFGRAFVRSYAQCVGLDPDDVVRRFEQQFRPPELAVRFAQGAFTSDAEPTAAQTLRPAPASVPVRQRAIATAADVTVAIVLAFGSAAAGSRLLWPVLLIAAYYAIGVLVTGTTPMVAMLATQPHSIPPPEPTFEPREIAAAAERQHAASRNDVESSVRSHRRLPAKSAAG